MTLESIIDKYGQPKAIINCSKEKTKKIIFDFEETIFLNHLGILFVNGVEQKSHILDSWQMEIERWKNDVKRDEIATMGFFSYDFKNFVYPQFTFNKKSKDKTPYFWFGKPGKVIEVSDLNYNFESYNLKIKQNLQEINYFKEKIEKIKNYLYSGDVYQINYTQPIIFDFNGNPFDLYNQIENNAKAKYGIYLDIEEMQILSFSPEKFFTLKNKELKSYPIKGTISRAKNKKNDTAKIKILKNSEKDKAEHLMIVDLIRNDIGQIAEFGTVKVNNLFGIKTFETIHHMETEIIGKIKSNAKEIDIVKSLFPGGSITGAPKYRSVQIIDEIETYDRGIYTGCIGTIFGNGDMDFNICIRTMTVENNLAQYPVGGGIIWDSNHKDEYLEAKEKANILQCCE